MLEGNDSEFASHHRREYFQHRPQNTDTPEYLLGFLQCNLTGDVLAFDHVLFDVVNDVGIVEGDRAFKVEVKAAEIHIAGAYQTNFVIRHKHFSVHKAGGIFVNFNAGLDEPLVMGAGKRMDIPFVVDVRGDDAYIDAALSGGAKHGFHLIVDYQIGRCNVDVFGSPRDNVVIGGFGDIELIQRAIVKYLYQSIAGLMGICLVILMEVDHFTGVEFPLLQKHKGKTPNSLTLKHNAGILPVPVTGVLVDVFIRQVNAAAKSGDPVNHTDFAVISVIEDGVDTRTEGVEYTKLNASAPDDSVIPIR